MGVERRIPRILTGKTRNLPDGKLPSSRKHERLEAAELVLGDVVYAPPRPVYRPQGVAPDASTCPFSSGP